MNYDIFGAAKKSALIMRALSIMFAFLLAGNAVALLQNPESNETNIHSSREVRGTDQSPIVVKVLPSSDTEKEATARQKEREEKANLDRKLVDLTADLAKYTSDLALFTMILAGIGVIQLIVFGYQSWQLKQSVDLEREEFISTHRPLIRIKHVYITSDIWGGQPMELKLVIVNAGISAATIRAMNIETIIIQSGKQLPPRPAFTEPDKTIASDKIESGITLALPKLARYRLTATEHPQLMSGGWHLYCFGFVEYADSNGRIRKTSFCRIWIPPIGIGAANEPGKFVVHPDPDYEYQD